MINLTKHQFKICEAVALGLTHYYMDKNDRLEVTEQDRKEAAMLLPKLPNGWMNEEQEWMLHKNPHKGRKKR
jgi:hypothetical protein